jgi:hypothetical protein
VLSIDESSQFLFRVFEMCKRLFRALKLARVDTPPAAPVLGRIPQM